MSLQAVREHIEQSPLRSCQVLVIALCVAMNMLDGFDILALSVISPTLSRQWHLAPQTLGLLFSAGLLGTAVGGFALSPLADLWGRRTAILINLVLMTLGMTLSATAHSVGALAFLRFCTGLGVGAMGGCVGTLAFEYCSIRTRALGLGVVVMGIPSAPCWGDTWPRRCWPTSAGGVSSSSAACAPWCCWGCRTSCCRNPWHTWPARRGPGALAALNRVLGRLRLPLLSELPRPS